MIILNKDEKRLIKELRRMKAITGSLDGFVIMSPDNVFSTDWISRHTIERKIRRYKLCEDWYSADVLERLLKENGGI
jgi:hypothetical protein